MLRFIFKKQKTSPMPSHPSIERARYIANLMDSAITIPIIGKKIGLDPILGLLPLGGDAISAVVSLFLIYTAYELGLPRSILIRMGINTLIDFLIGSIPVVGDISDMFIKSNQWNFKLLEQSYQHYGSAKPTPGSQVIDISAEAVPS